MAAWTRALRSLPAFSSGCTLRASLPPFGAIFHQPARCLCAGSGLSEAAASSHNGRSHNKYFRSPQGHKVVDARDKNYPTGRSERMPTLHINITNQHAYGQVVSADGVILAQASTVEKGLERKGWVTKDDTRAVGTRLGQRCVDANVMKAVHKRSERFHGKYKEFILGFAQDTDVTLHSVQKPFQE